MLHFAQTLLLFGILTILSTLTQGFTPVSTYNVRRSRHPTDLLSASLHNEEASVDTQNQVAPESASILPGQVVSIRIGDMSNPRKAWKKRRRTGSPVLVPCTILGMNKEVMVKNNLMNLLHRFGKPSDQENQSNGVFLSVGAAVKLYKYRLGGNLLEHAKALGYDTILNMLEGIFDDNFFRENGVKVMRYGPKNELFLSSSLSTRLARESAFKAEFIQFCPSQDEADRMIHTGTTLNVENSDKYKTLTSSDTVQPLSAAVRISQVDADSGRFQTGMECNAFFHSYDGMGDNGSPLVTCAIDPPSGQIRDQMKRRAYVKRQIEAQTIRERALARSTTPGLDLKDLKVGDGPYVATVIKVSPRAGSVFVDLGVTRKKGKKSGGGTAKVLGMLRFDDILHGMNSDEGDGISREEAALIEASLLEGSDNDLEDEDEDDYDEDDDILTVDDLFMDDEEEIEDDVSDIYSVDEDGNVYMLDTATGKKKIIGSVDDDDDDDAETDEGDDDVDDMFAGMNPEERLMAIGAMLEKTETSRSAKQVQSKDMTKNKSKKSNGAVVSLKQGDEVNVFIRSVFPQSGRFMVTQDARIKNRKLKDLKREKLAEKRLEKLHNKMGGTAGVQYILSCVGLEMEGVVKAKSKTGNWYYVQPQTDGFPVGVANSDIDQSLEPGQKAKIRVEGIDEARGQLSLTILSLIE